MRWLIVGVAALGVANCATETPFVEIDGVDYVSRSFAPAAGDGAVRVECTVRADGGVEDCEILSEEPAGFGYGEAALRAAAANRMPPGTGPVGGRVQYNVRFREATGRHP